MNVDQNMNDENQENQENQNDQVWTRVLEWVPRSTLTPPKVWIELEE